VDKLKTRQAHKALPSEKTDSTQFPVYEQASFGIGTILATVAVLVVVALLGWYALQMRAESYRLADTERRLRLQAEKQAGQRAQAKEQHERDIAARLANIEKMTREKQAYEQRRDELHDMRKDHRRKLKEHQERYAREKERLETELATKKAKIMIEEYERQTEALRRMK